MTQIPMKLENGEVVPWSDDEIAQRDEMLAVQLADAKAQKAEQVRQSANIRVMDALPDMPKAEAVRAHQANLLATITSKRTLHTLAAIDITAGWPE